MAKDKVEAGSARGNVVLYRDDGKSLDGNRVLYPIFSCDAGDKLAPVKIVARMSAAMMEFDRQGVPHSQLHVVREYREADESGRLTLTEYAFFDPMTPSADQKTTKSLNDLFA